LPRHANSPEWLILGWKNLPKSFYTRIWWVGERWFHTLPGKNWVVGDYKNIKIDDRANYFFWFLNGV
jgi:hypothetical protein